MRPIALAVLVLALSLALAGTAAPEEKTDSELWTLDTGSAGIELTELFARVQAATGERFLFNPHDPAIKAKKIFVIGAVELALERVLPWLQAAVSYHKLVLVPMGAGDGRVWAILNVTDPALANHARTVPVHELEEWADRHGVFIETVIPLEHVRDTARVRNALANLVTRPMGRVQDVPGSQAIVVADFAPVVAGIARLVEELDVAPAPVPGKTATERKAPAATRRHYEQMLCGARTKTAARYFRDKLAELDPAEEK